MTNAKRLNFKILTAVILLTAVLSPVFLQNANAQEVFGPPAPTTTETAAATTASNTGGILGTLGFIKNCLSAAGIIDCLLTPILWLVQGFFALFIEIAAMLVNLSFKINDSLGQNVVITGWNITNALANLGFVLFIIIIAFATVVRWPGYGLKDILWKLIAAALLVNFSLLIAFVFIDFSNVLSQYFLTAATKSGANLNSWDVGGSLANGFRIQTIQRVPDSTSAIADTAKSIINVAVIKSMSILIQIVFNFIITCTLLALAAAMMVRFVILSILLILAPMAWLLWITPATSKYWHEWWDKFIKWVFFAPAMTFFIYIALAIPQAMQLDSLSGVASKGMTNTSFIADLFVQVGNMVVIVGLLIGGLMTANKMGIAGAAMFYKGVQKAGKAAQGAVGRTAARGASYPLRTEAGRELTEKLQQAGSSSNRFVKALTRPIREIGHGISGTRRTAEKYITKPGENAVKGMSYQEMARQYGTSSGPKRAAILKQLANTQLKDGSTGMSLLPKTARGDFKEDLKRYTLLYGQHETFQKRKTAKGKTASGEEIELELPEEYGENTQNTQGQSTQKKASKLVDQFGKPI